MSVEGEHLLQVIKHVIKQSFTSKATLEWPLVSALGGLLVGMELTLKVPLVVGVLVVVVLLLLLLAERVKVCKHVVEVEAEGLVVEVLASPSFSSSSSSSCSLPIRWPMANLVILPPPLII